MASFTYKEIEQNLQKLQHNTNPDEIGYLILSAFGTTDTYIRRYKSGKGNMAKDGGLLVKKSIAFQTAPTIKLTESLEAMKADEHIARQKARILAVSDGKTILAYDPVNKESYENNVDKLWLDFQFFFPLGGVEKYIITEENPADVKAAEKMAKLHNEIRRFNEFSSEADWHDLNVFMMRLLFCFFAEDTHIFDKGIFTDFIHRYTLEDGSNLTQALDEVFNVMDEPLRVGQSRVFAQFPYVNGGLFHTRIAIPKMGMRARKLILECSELNWGEINPDIFGSMMQAVVTPELRAGLGMHYTSVPNIMKVIQPLFLNELEEAFANAFDNQKKLDTLLIRISKMKFFDPACGSGNFLIITYKELRRLEIRIWQRIAELTGIRILPFSNLSISQFYGIELDSFGHEIAMLSLWLAEHQMNAEFTRTFTQVKIDALPLKNITTIVQGNACRVDWNEVCPHTPEEEVFVFGNPPYLGSGIQEETHKDDMAFVFRKVKDYRKLDYISCWFYLASRYIANSICNFAFVSTNSICQGEQVPILWKMIFNMNMEIFFAYKPFLWRNNAKHNAAVSVTVIGVRNKNKKPKFIYNELGQNQTENINAYLINYKDIFIIPQNKSISNYPAMIKGSSPGDNGNLLLNEIEKDELLIEYPQSAILIKKYFGADEFVNSKKRYCLLIEEENIDLAYTIPFIKERLRKCALFRLSSKKEATKRKAATPYFFDERKYQNRPSIIVPQTGSERREYLPLGILDKDCVISNAARLIYDGDMLLFGFLASKIHMVWIRAIAGRLKNDMQYSNTLCYNTFPFPTIPEAKKKEIEALAEEVLLTREHHTEKTLAQMYDPDKMPKDLREAHRALDLAVDNCYPGAPFANDEERLEVLFKMYERMTKK